MGPPYSKRMLLLYRFHDYRDMVLLAGEVLFKSYHLEVNNRVEDQGGEWIRD